MEVMLAPCGALRRPAAAQPRGWGGGFSCARPTCPARYDLQLHLERGKRNPATAPAGWKDP